MGSQPINLALRFLLELAALGAVAYWGWAQHDGLESWLWASGLPLIAAVLWGTFAVPWRQWSYFITRFHMIAYTGC